MIGEEVRRRREELGLTGAQLAVRASMSPSAVSQIETGKRTPSSGSVIKLAAALGAEVGDLYPAGEAPLPFDDSVVAEMEATLDAIRENVALLEEYLENPPDEATADEAMERFYDLMPKPMELLSRMSTRDIRLYISDVRDVFDAQIRVSRQLDAWNTAQYGHLHRDVG
jgi:transcriptional regulator with XRE-family HTH domain